MAAQEVQTGVAILYGIRNNGTIISLSGYATFILDSVGGTHKFELLRVRNELNFTVNLSASDSRFEGDIVFTPSAATRSAVEAETVFLAPLAAVAIANFNVTAFNGTWVYIGDEKIELNHQAGKITLKLEKYADASQNTSLTTTVVG